ncbi:MAG TPA: hypothetical protein PK109_01290 [Candidatus Paceibacterota bacterium]|nr:hypothetical protein [Candidatus Paceibacterota bacterium]
MDDDEKDLDEPLDLDDEVSDLEGEEAELDSMGMHIEEPKDDTF